MGQTLITLHCDNCEEEVSFAPTITSGNIAWATADADHEHSADVSHAWRHGGWCTVTGDDAGACDHCDALSAEDDLL